MNIIACSSRNSGLKLALLPLIMTAFLISPISANAEDVSFSKVVDQQSGKKTDLEKRKTSGNVCEDVDFGWYIKQYSCKADTHGNHGDNLSCTPEDALKQTTADGKELVTRACCNGSAEIKKGPGGIGKTARFRCVLEGVKTNQL
ncbi:hypothetical protein [Thiocapsa rosea]|uniref:hypothetical protein n=1 Tax=Thiocapsa rosea TaxID=69360 RepID=UPI0011C3F2D6|nr:hypothetical protein [Thiocapsa rosea]